ncbi:MAG: RsmD family RNA methyltransferase [Nitrosomonadales bacterium]
MQENSKKLSCVNIALRCEDGIEFARRESGSFDVVFLDPPFRSGFLPKVLPLLGDKLRENALVYVESGEPFEPDATWKVVRQAKAGKVFYQLLQHA